VFETVFVLVYTRCALPLLCLALVATGLLGGCSPASPDDNLDSLALSLRYREGWTYEFEAHATHEFSLWVAEAESPHSNKYSSEQDSTMHVISVDPNGVATVQHELRLKGEDAISLYGAGFEAPTISTIAPTGEQTVNIPADLRENARLPNGDKIPAKYPVILPVVPQFLSVGGTYPLQPRRPGDSWTYQLDVPFPWNDTSVAFTSETKFLRFEEIDGRRTAMLASEIRGTYDVTMSLRDFLIRSGQRATEAMMPSQLEPSIRFLGSVTTYHRVSLDVGRRIPVRSRSETLYSGSYTLSGIPQRYLFAGEIFRQDGRLVTLTELVSARPTANDVSG
jgi:hypothetical protein